MNMREKLLLGAVLLALLYAGYEFFLKKDTPETWTPGAEAAEKALAGFATEAKSRENGRLYAGLLDTASADWDQDPFLKDLPVEKEVPEDTGVREVHPPDWIYMGYMALGNLRIAVISGVEYAEGEKLMGQEELRIVLIDEDFVMLEGPKKRQVVLERRGGDAW